MQRSGYRILQYNKLEPDNLHDYKIEGLLK